MRKLKHLELFSGIGGFRQAFELLQKDEKIQAECVGYSEIDSHASTVYKANFDNQDVIEMGDIISFNEDLSRIKRLPDFDILTGGFPCQAFSMMGKQKGFEDKRGNVFFEIIKILEQKKPSFILLENVRNLTSHDKGNTFSVIKESLYNAGYKYIYSDIFNTNNFGLAQKRNRVYIFASRNKLDDSFSFKQSDVSRVFKTISSQTSLEKQRDVLDVLEKNAPSMYYLSEIIKPTILADGSANYHSKSRIDCLIAKPLTATMVKMHRANQDNYYSYDFLNSENPYEFILQKFTKDELVKKQIRKLTPKEAFLLQGFSDSFFLNASRTGISNHQLYKQAGNAASVNTIYAILYYLFIYQKISS